ncbi:MAG: glycosyltransferase family 4 protein [Bacteroidales bacterium]|nr:glycosyltransferase family 4 protein [Bacteroidales bacterium]
MKKVLYISYYWPPCGGPGVQRSLKFVKYLKQYGIEPIVITVDPAKASYPVMDTSLLSEIPNDIRIIKTSTLEPFGIYERLTKKKELPHSGFANESNPGFLSRVSRFIRGNFFIPDPRAGWNRYLIKAALKVISTENIDAIITSSPPHSTQLAGLRLCKKTGIPWIADLRDPWTDIYYYRQLYHTKPALWLDKKYEKSVIEMADAILVVSDSLKRLFSAKTDEVEASKIHVLANGYDRSDFPVVEHIITDVFRIVYTGTISDDYPLDVLVNSLIRLRDSGRTNWQIEVCGKLSPALHQWILKSDIASNFRFVPYMSHQDVVIKMQKSEVLLLIIPDIEDNAGILTGKLFEYIAAQRPILGIGPVNGDASAILRETGSGEMFDYNNMESVTQYLSIWYDVWQSGNWEFAPTGDIEKYSREALTGQLVEIINLYSKSG